MFLALRQLRFARGRMLVIGLVVALMAALVVIVTGFTNGLTADTISAIRTMPASHVVFSADATSAQFSRSLVDRDMLEAWQTRLGDDVVPFGTTIAHGRTDAGADVEFALFGVEPGSFVAPRVEAGSPVGDERGVVISREIADDGVAIGDVLVVDRLGVELPIVGITGEASFGHVAAAYSSLDIWRQLRFGLPGGGVPTPVAFQQSTALAIRGDPGDADRLDAQVGTQTMTRSESFAGAPGYSGETMIMNTIRIFLYVISALVVGAFFVVLVQQRRGEIALLKAVGAGPGYVVRTLLAEILCLLVPSVLAGCAVAWLTGVVVQRTVPFEQRPVSVAVAAVLLVATGLAAVVVTARRAASVDPLVALGLNR